mgnify:CR=1 FL=1
MVQVSALINGGGHMPGICVLQYTVKVIVQKYLAKASKLYAANLPIGSGATGWYGGGSPIPPGSAYTAELQAVQ